MIRLATAIYRGLLGLLPAHFRQEFEEEAVDVFERLVRDAKRAGGPLAALQTALGEYTGLFRAVSEERLERLTGEGDRERGYAGLTGLSLDLKQAVRGLRSRPGTTFTVCVTMALAIGATTSVYSVVDGVLLRPLPYPEPDRLGRVWQTRPDWRDSPRESLRLIADRLDPTAPARAEWARHDTGFQSLGAYVDAAFSLWGPDGASMVRGQEATSGLFDALGVAPKLGRALSPSDDVEGAAPVVVLSEALWNDGFGASEDALGLDLILDGMPHTVIGVMPSEFQTPDEARRDAVSPGGTALLWTQLTREARRGWKNVTVIGRLEDGVTWAVAQEQLASVQAGLTRELPDGEARRGVRVTGLLDSVISEVRSTLWFLLAAVGLVLLVATVNIANILTALGLARRHEMAVRAAIGAGPVRLVRTLFMESAVLATLGGLGGVVISWVTLPALVRLLPPSLPRQELVAMNGSVLLVGLVASGLTALLIGVLPAALAARSRPQRALRDSGRGRTAGGGAARIRGVLVAGEVSLAFVLLVGAGLLAGSYANLSSVERGFVTDGLVAMWVEPDASAHPTLEDQARFRADLRAGLERIPGVTASAANTMPLSGLSSGTRVVLERPMSGPEEIGVLLSVGMTNYLDVMGIPVVSGRGFELGDTRDAPPVAIINETMARQGWPTGDAIGSRLRTGDDDFSIEIIGIAADVRHHGLAAPVEPKVYLPASQSSRDTNEWILRVRGDLETTLRKSREALAAVSPTTATTRLLVLDESIAASVALPRFRTFFIIGLAGLAAVLALLGVYGVLSFSVAQRRREIGIRMAMGARRHVVVLEVVRGGVRLMGAGIGVGLFLAWFGSGLIGRFLFEVAPRDAPTYIAIVLALLAVGSLATYLPARRAASVDPVEVLAGE